MKKLFTLIACCFSAVCISAAPKSDISSYKNYLYIPDDTKFVAGTETTVEIKLRQTGWIQGAHCEIVFPEGWTVKAPTLVKKSLFQVLTDPEDEESTMELCAASGLAAKGTVATAATTGLGTAGGYDVNDPTKYYNFGKEDASHSYYNYKEGEDIVLFKVKVTPAAASGTPATITFTDCELCFNDPNYKTNPDLSDYAWNNYCNPAITAKETGVERSLVFEFDVEGATGVDGVSEDGAEAAAPAKKIVDGQLVIETANGTFNAAGAQVK